MFVYALIDPRDGDVRYIGQTRSRPAQRLAQHMTAGALKSRCHRTAWLRLLKSSGLRPVMRTLHACASRDEMSSAERYWIAFFKAQGADLVNATSGGESGATFAPHVLERMSELRRGVKVSAATREKLRVAGLGKRHTPETKQKMSQSQSSRVRRPRGPHSDELKQKISNGVKAAASRKADVR